MDSQWVRRFTFALALLQLLCAASAHAQLSGVVRDSATNMPLQDAIVTVRALGLKTTTNAQGEFSFDAADATLKKDAMLAAASVGYYIRSMRVADVPDAGSGVELLLEKVPTVDESTAWEFPEPIKCADCHQTMYTTWLSSAMSHAGVNTWTMDLYSGDGTPGGSGGFVYKRDSKLAHGNPNSECAACHQPELWAKQPGVALVNDPERAEVKDGVSCLICHRIANVDVSKINFPGLHSEKVDFLAPVPGHIVQFGPLPDVTFEKPWSMRPAYQPQIRAEVCAVCHQDKNDPDEDGDFEEDNGVISEPTYLEWAASTYADEGSENYKTCADCHMEVSPEKSACDVVKPDPPRMPGELRKHRFEGTTAQFLENAVTMSMETQVTGSELQVEVSIENDKTGHHVPTGVTIRNMILLVEAINVSDGKALKHTGEQVVHELGGLGDPEDGYFAGLPGKLFAKINDDEEGASPVFYTEAAGIVSDNRIAAGDTDVSRYTFQVPKGEASIEVRARLIYRRSWRAVVDAKQWTEDGRGRPLEDIQPPHFGHLMAEQVEQIESSSDAQCSDASCEDAESKTDAGCGCRVVGAAQPRSSRSALALAALLVVAARLGRRRRTRVQSLP